MRLLIGVDSSVWGGAEAHVATLLAELPDRFECTLLASAGVPERLAEAARDRGEVVLVPPVRGKTDLRGLRALAKALTAVRPGVVHVNQAAPTNNRHLLGVAIARRIPTVAVLHLWSPVASSGLQAQVMRATYRRAAAVVVVSRDLRDRAVTELGVRPERAFVVRNGVDLLPAAAVRDAPAPLRVGALGRLVHHKGFDVLVEAVRRLGPEGPVEVVLAGDGPEREALERAVAGLPVRLVGPVPSGAAFLAGMDAFVLPSRDEGLPLALLEALSCGLPSVVTDVGDVREAVGAAALVVPPDDPAALAAALAALADPDLRARLSGAGRQRVGERYTAAAMAAATADVYDAAVRL